MTCPVLSHSVKLQYARLSRSNHSVASPVWRGMVKRVSGSLTMMWWAGNTLRSQCQTRRSALLASGLGISGHCCGRRRLPFGLAAGAARPRGMKLLRPR